MVKIVIIKGGLGNQMFGYAFYLSIKKRFPYSVIFIDVLESWFVHNGIELFSVFKTIEIRKYQYYRRLNKIYNNKCLNRIFKREIEAEVNYGSYQENITKNKYPFLIFDGFWQSNLYFNEFESQIRKKYRFDITCLNKESLQYLEMIKEMKSVSIHIRRGDYLKHEDDFGSICTRKYYLDAIKYIELKEFDLTYFFFTDDVDWVRNNYAFPHSVIVDCNKGLDCWQDMCLMSFCKHNIIANSTFSWWGAWLNENDEKIVIAPKRWFNQHEARDIIPSSWVQI